ncbi:MAG: diguanylate cyclase response regulator [Gammaproteobacteria bacterium]|nr:MAG: diguanylate cyclase response regulator [Gammaproteobacteria bacterium]
MPDTKKLLLVEDSSLVLKVLKRIIDNNAEFEADFAETYAEAKLLIADKPEKYFAALVDLNLPDAPKGEVVDLVLQNKIPTIVLTSSYSEKRKDDLISKGVVDYVVKETRYSYESAIKIISRLSKNHNIKVMIVDDSSVARQQCSRLLEKYLFQVVEADGAKQAINQLVNNPDIKLVITDYNMPDTDGFELVKLIRTKYDKQDLTIIGLSGDGDTRLSARFIKNGANDFLKKPFVQEEFYCRIMHNIETLELMDKIRDAANRDYLTQLFSRQYYYKLVNDEIKRAQENASPFCIAIIEIDDFDEFNNVYHNYGDNVALAFSEIFSSEFEQYLIGRLNGTQFVIFLNNKDEKEAFEVLDSFRIKVKDIKLHADDDAEENTSISISVSISSESKYEADETWSINPLLEKCDQLLERARDAGQDIVVYD